MAEIVLDIKQWGNNLGVRLPATITPVEDVDLTLAQRHGQRTAEPFPRDRYCQDQRV